MSFGIYVQQIILWWRYEARRSVGGSLSSRPVCARFEWSARCFAVNREDLLIVCWVFRGASGSRWDAEEEDRAGGDLGNERQIEDVIKHRWL